MSSRDVSSGELLEEAVAELYSADPEEFVRRRQELVGRAREAGQAPAARQIAALRKPTRAAWVVNQLARSDTGAVSGLAELGGQLRAAERSGDGARLRELSRERRRLIASLVHRALEASGQRSAPAALREEITATFATALADPEVAEQIERGTLVRAEQRAGFGTAQAPDLSVVPPAGRAGAGPGRARDGRGGTADTGSRPGDGRGRAGRTRTGPARKGPAAAEREDEPGRAAGRAAQAEVARKRREVELGRAAQAKVARKRREAGAVQAAAQAEERAARAQAARERRAAELAKVRDRAERALADADRAAADAARDQQEQERTIRRLERELADARRRLRGAAADARRARAAGDRARQALDRLSADLPRP